MPETTLAVFGHDRQIARQADSDAQLVALWLHDRPISTRRAYERDAERFLTFVGKPLPT